MSEHLHQMVGELQANQDTYEPNESVRRKLSEYTLTLLIGPTATGKSTLIQEIINQDDRFSDVGILSTRAARADDPPHYRTNVPIADMTQQVADGSLVQYHVHPSGDIYATDLESYETKYSILPAMSDSVEKFLKLGFGRVVMVGVYLHGRHWEDRLRERENDPGFMARLDEASISLEWMIENSKVKRFRETAVDLNLVENSNGQLEQAAQKIIQISGSHTQVPYNRIRFKTRFFEMNAIIRNLKLNHEPRNT